METLADYLVAIANFLVGRADLAELRLRDRRDRAARYLERISGLLEEIANDFLKRRNLDKQCTELGVALKNLAAVLDRAGIKDEPARVLIFALLDGKRAPFSLLRTLPFWPRNLVLNPSMFLDPYQREHVLRVLGSAVSLDETHGPDATDAEVAAELAKLQQASGLFRGVAEALRAIS